MLDNTLVNIISLLIEGIGLIGAITRFEIPGARIRYYGKDQPDALKSEIINDMVVRIFSCLAGLGILFQILCGEILGDLITGRLYNDTFYLGVFAIGLAFAPIIIYATKLLSR
jgi:hypothetical protein